MKIELTKEEINELLRLLDIATRARGLNVAKNCLYFAQKLEQAVVADNDSAQ